MRMIVVAAVLFVGIYALPLYAEESVTGSTKLTEGTYADVRDAILIRSSKQRWEEVPWRPNLAVAIEEARKTDQPILLWMMNGHPCGMT